MTSEETGSNNNVTTSTMLLPSPIYTLKQVEENKNFLSSLFISLSNEDFKTEMMKKKAWRFTWKDVNSVFII
jgi:hypothetical protein